LELLHVVGEKLRAAQKACLELGPGLREHMFGRFVGKEAASILVVVLGFRPKALIHDFRYAAEVRVWIEDYTSRLTGQEKLFNESAKKK
jgi:hypothetical protein